MHSHTVLLLVFILFMFVNRKHNLSHGANSRDTVVVLSDRTIEDYGDIPREPRRFHDSKFRGQRAMRLNVPTRGDPPAYQQVGLLQGSEDSQNVKPLYGRQTYPGSNQWNYFTSLDSHLATKIPIERDSRDCTDEHGCQELQKNNTLNVLDQEYNVNIYGTVAPRYIPY
jgi:hypothetical protein